MVVTSGHRRRPAPQESDCRTQRAAGLQDHIGNRAGHPRHRGLRCIRLATGRNPLLHAGECRHCMTPAGLEPAIPGSVG